MDLQASMGPSMIVDGKRRGAELGAATGDASMGPSMIVDGKGFGCRVRDLDSDASMGPSMIVDGKSPPAPTSPWSSPRFNGAVDDRRRKGAVRSAAPILQSQLQWGRR